MAHQYKEENTEVRGWGQSVYFVLSFDIYIENNNREFKKKTPTK